MSDTNSFSLPQVFQFVKHFFQKFQKFFLPNPHPAALAARTNLIIIPYALAFVKYFFQGRCVFPTALPRLKHPSLKRSITIPEPTPFCQHLFSLFFNYFLLLPYTPYIYALLSPLDTRYIHGLRGCFYAAPQLCNQPDQKGQEKAKENISPGSCPFHKVRQDIAVGE